MPMKTSVWKIFSSTSGRLEAEGFDVPVRIMKQCLILTEVVGNTVPVIHAGAMYIQFASLPKPTLKCNSFKVCINNCSGTITHKNASSTHWGSGILKSMSCYCCIYPL